MREELEVRINSVCEGGEARREDGEVEREEWLPSKGQRTSERFSEGFENSLQQ